MSMKTLNPFNAPGSSQAERQRMRRERFKIVVWTVAGVNVLLFAGMLIQGCQREPATSTSQDTNPVEAASSDSNGAAMAQPTPGTTAPVTPTFQAPAPDTGVPAGVTKAAPEPAQPGTWQYVVVKGDSFYKIARANKVSMKALADANAGVDSARLKIGQVLQVPAGAEPAAASPGALACARECDSEPIDRSLCGEKRGHAGSDRAGARDNGAGHQGGQRLDQRPHRRRAQLEDTRDQGVGNSRHTGLSAARRERGR